MAKFRRARRAGRSEEAIDFAREQRVWGNEFSDSVWHMLRNQKCYGLKFRREHPVPPYTADFCCLSAKLIIEVDGKWHMTADGQRRDERRDRFFEQRGFRILRIPGYDVIRDGAAVRDRIFAFVAESIGSSANLGTE